MKKFVFSFILFTSICATGFAQKAIAKVSKNDTKQARSSSEVTATKVKVAPKVATAAVVGLSQEQQDAERTKQKQAFKKAQKAKVKPVVAAETAENAGQ